MAAFSRGDVFYAPINAASSGANTVVAAVAGKSILVVNYTLAAAGAVAATWKTAATASLSGAMTLATGTPVAAPQSETGHLLTNAGEALVLSLGGAVQVSGHLAYILV